MFRSRFFRATMLAMVAMVAAPATSEAGFSITLSVGSDPANRITIDDNSSGDSNSTAGLITTSGSLAGFTYSGNFAFSNSGPSAGGSAILTITSLTINLTGNTAKTLVITLQDTGFNSPVPGAAYVTSQLTAQSLNGATNSSAQFQSYVGGVAGTQLSVENLGMTPGAKKFTDGMIVPSSPYTLSNVLTLNLDAGSVIQATGSTEVTSTPAPTGLVMLAGALPFAGLLRLRRFRKNEVATAA